MASISERLVNKNQEIIEQLTDRGYAVMEGMLSKDELEQVRSVVDRLFAEQRQSPYDPGESPASPEDAAIEALLAESYAISEAELKRTMRLIRHERHLNHDTPWPVPPNQVVRMFVHLPGFFDMGKTQVVRNLPGKDLLFGRLVEDARVLSLARAVLGNDCVLSDISANSIGPG